MAVAVSASQPTTVQETPKIKEWSYSTIDLFKKILSSDGLEAFPDFKSDIEDIYKQMTSVLQKTRPTCDLLASNREEMEKTCTELYQTIIAGRKEKTSDTDLITKVVKSKVFLSLIPDSEETLTKNNEKNYNFFNSQLSPRRLTEFPSLQKCKDVLNWFTLASLAITSREDQDKFSSMSALPQKIIDKAAEDRKRIGEIMFNSFTKSDCQLLIQVFNNDKVTRVFGEYLRMFEGMRVDDKDYSPVVLENLKVGLPYLVAKLPETREETKKEEVKK